MNNAVAVDRFLAHLGIGRQAPGLDYLNRILYAHQLRVPFETLTKLIDYEPGLARGDFLPPIELYIDRLARRGAGGLCWTLTRGLHFLLTGLGFEAAYMVMNPGHCCVRVELPEGSYYADVGYSAPIFQAYPLFESFTIESASERFEYDVREDGIQVTRNPGPAKQLDPAPRTIDSLKPNIDAANDWQAPRSFLAMLAVSKYIDGIYTSFQNGTLNRYRSGRIETTLIEPADQAAAVGEVFGIDPMLFNEAAAIRARYLPTRDNAHSGVTIR